MVHSHSLDTRKTRLAVFPAREHFPLTRDRVLDHAERGQTVRLYDNRGLLAPARGTRLSAHWLLQRCDFGSDGARLPQARTNASRGQRRRPMTGRRTVMANTHLDIEPTQEPQTKTTT